MRIQRTFGLLCVWLGVLALPTLAQFATNTPPAPNSGFATVVPAGNLTVTPIAPIGSGGFATATPLPVSPTPRLPDAPVQNYGLSIWLESTFLEVYRAQLAAVKRGVPEAELALRLTQYELFRRFPNAPTNPQDLAELVAQLREAPIGSVDMRPFVRRYVLAELNRMPDAHNLRFDGFTVSLQAARLNTDGLVDALVMINYPSDPTPDNPPRYQDYVLAIRNTDGTFSFLPYERELPLYPDEGVNAVIVVEVSDINNDGLDEVAFGVDDGDVNARYVLIAARNNRAVDLVIAPAQIRVGEVVNWDYERGILAVNEWLSESTSPDWVCRSQRAVEWHYENNYYRRVGGTGDFTRQNTLGCYFHHAEPILSKTPVEAIPIVEQGVQSFPYNSESIERGVLLLGFLYALDGRAEQAKITLGTVVSGYGADSWAGKQAQAMMDILDRPNSTILDLCAASYVGDAPVCAMDDLLGYLLSIINLDTAQDLVTQLNQFGLTARAVDTLSEVGRATRTIIQFDIVGAGRWAFAAERNGMYRAERLPAPVAVATVSSELPQSVLNALLQDNNPQNALALLETFARAQGGVIPPRGLYVRALAYDLLGNRNDARQAYYTLWQTAPETVWGQLAGLHLE